MGKIVFIGLLIMALALAGCAGRQASPDSGLVNQTLNQELENLTIPGAANFTEFFFDYTPRDDALFELAKDDVFSQWNSNITSADISVLGVKIGDNYSQVIDRMGIPDVMYVPADKSYRNMEYGRKIGVKNITTAITYHLENDTVNRITLRRPFNKYLQGNTTFGQSKEFVYDKIGVPDYQDFTSSQKIFAYVTQGVELYMTAGGIDVISFVKPRKFNGVVYISRLEEIADGVYANVTRPVLK